MDEIGRMTKEAGVLIIGAGQAGAYAAIALRNHGYTGSITMVGEEASLPYERPPLSKEYFSGKKTFERLLIRPETYWSQANITLLTGEIVVAVDAFNHVVKTENGAHLSYDKCIWAAGGKPRQLNCSGADLKGIHSFRTREDADKILETLATVEHIVIIGGGYIGLESASALIQKGKKVTLLEAGPRVLARVAGETVSDYFETLHRKNGVDIRVGVNLHGFSGKEHVETVHLDDGEEIHCGMVIVGIGIIPCVAPLIEAGAKGGNGVEVNAHCETSLPDVYAIGDCALHYNQYANGLAVRLESVQNANDQAVTAAQNIVGKQISYEAVPWFWSNQYDVRLQTVGLSIGYDEVVLKGKPADNSFSVFYLKERRIIAVDCINSPRDFIYGKKMIHQEFDLSLVHS